MRLRLSLLAACTATVLAAAAPAAWAAGAPEITSSWVAAVTPSSANLNGDVDANGLPTTFRFEYIAAAAYQANLAAANDGFSGALKAPAGGEANVGSGEAPIALPVQHIGALEAGTAYRFRLRAANSAGTVFGPVRSLQTREKSTVFSLPDGRGWELVSPLDKNGGQIAAPESLLGGGVLQAAAQGGAVTFSSAFSFGSAQAAATASQYVSRRGPAAWSTENITGPALSGSYPHEPDSGVPYQLFSPDLSTGLLSNGRRCRGESTQCPVANPPLPGSGAPAGYRNYYLRNGAGSFQALLDGGDVAGQQAANFELAFAGATPDLSQIVISTCAALTADATEVPGSGGACDPAAQNLYRGSGSGLVLLNLLPSASTGTPGAALAAQSGAISIDGARVYWQALGNLYLREGTQTKQVDEAQGGGGTFQTASTDGSVAYFTKAGHLYRYLAASSAATDLTPAGEVQGVLGASADGSYLYYLTSSGLQLWHAGTVTPIAGGADAGDYPPATGSSRVSADGTRLAFVSSAEIVSYDNRNLESGVPEPEVYLYSAPAQTLTCVSCNPLGERPLGPSTIPGAVANGTAVEAYKPRVLSGGGSRIFFESADSLAALDGNKEPDVYQWEAQGTGGCTGAGGCVNLISSGRAEEGASFVDASADGADAFFLTDGSLVSSDPGSIDIYDARIGGGFPSPDVPFPCVGDACQVVPGEPEDPSPGTLFSRPEGNPAPNLGSAKKHKKAKKHRKHKKGHHAKRPVNHRGGRR
jgi:hypothetical protein